MDQKARYRYTNFPNLYDTVKSKYGQATLQADWPISLPQEILILSWATLLQSYTSITEPVFSFEGRAVQVNAPLGPWNEVEVEDLNDQDGHHTSIALEKPFGRPALALELWYDAHSGKTALSSACCIPESFLQQILSQFQHIVVHRAASDDVISFGSAPLLSIVNPQGKVLPGPHLLHELVNAASPLTIAIDFLSSEKQRVQVSYQDLSQRSDRLATRLRSALALCYDRHEGCVENIIVPILVPQSPELYVSQIAILKSGAAFCPLNLDVPPERLKFIMEDVSAKVVVTTQNCRHRFSESNLGFDIISLVIDEDCGDPAAADVCVSGFSQATIHAERLAYVMYTSGSTGLPKGVGVSHGAVTQALLAHDEHVPQYHRFLQFAAPTFDVSVFEIFFTFCRGANLVCCHREDMLSDLTGIMNELRVDAAELTPTVAGTLLRNWDAVPCLNLLLTIGEMLPRSVIENFAESPDGGRVLLPMYGPTEASIHCTIVSTINNEARAGTIGRPLSTVSAFVIAEEQSSEPQILPMGHIGELAVGGQLAQGYISRPEQTRAAFVKLPGYSLVYRTGDRARLLPSGELECIGRIASGQIKIRGQRVELGEIEQVIGQVNTVHFAVAIIIDGNLIVFCLIDDEALVSLSRQALQDKCRAWLPPFMRPTDYVFLTQDLPRLSSGKVDKRSLETIYLDQNLRARSDEDDPASDLENLVAEVIREDLGIDVTRYEDLWSKGLDSLRSISLASKLRDRNIQVSATDILSADTIATLSEALQQRQAPHSALVAAVIDQVDPSETLKDDLRPKFSAAEFAGIEDIVACSKLQSAMLSESVIAKHVNFNWLKIEMAKSVCVTDFVHAFCRLAKLNDILRSGFVESSDHESQFARIIWKSFDPAGQIRYEEPDLAGVNASGESHDLALLRPLRLTVAAYPNHTTILVNIHHSLYDGWSWDLMMTDLELLVHGAKAHSRPNFQHFVQHERAFLSSEKATAAQEYWAGHLRGVAPTPLPVLNHGKCRAETRTFCRASEVRLSSLDDVSQRLRISRHSIPSAAFATLLKLYCGTSEVVFGSVSSGRTLPIPGIEDIVGPCISTLPVKINFDHLRTVDDLLLHTHCLHHNFLHFGQLPLRDIKKAAGITGDQALFDALFVWQESLGSKQNVKSALSVTDGTDSLQYALVLEIEPGCHQLKVKATYNASVLCAEQIEMLVNQFEAIVVFYAQASNMPWEEVLGHIRPQDLSIANSNFSSVKAAIEMSSTVDRLARDDPSRIAIEFVYDLDPVNSALKVSKVSYRDLSYKAGLVSQYLLSKGVPADEIVCLFMHKSIQLYVSILGVLKAGAAYIAVDPQAPLDRTRRILEGAKCRYSLTNGEFQDHEALSKVENVLFFDEVAVNGQHKALRPTFNGTNLAYAVFTSGSTGTPKGVLITRNNVLSNIDVLSRVYPSVAGGALLQACSPAFDVSVFEILYTWHMGMRLCAASNDIMFRNIERFIKLLKITHLSLTPSVAALIRPNSLPNVEMLVTAGEAVTPKVFRDWTGRGLYQGYGPSETTNICSVHCEISVFDHINNIGQPLPNTSMFISSGEAFIPLPKGALGEIWIGGDQVGRGYLNDANLTAEKFVDHREYGRLYRSGDLGRMLPNGSTLFHGREDDQVKLRGQRIELGEIEHALLHESAVSDGICLLIEGSEQVSSRLVAYWSLTSPLNVDPISYNKSLFGKLQSKLPAYMVPDYLIHVDLLPLTSQGKTDRKALKQVFLNMEPTTLEKHSRQEDPLQGEDFVDESEIRVAQAIVDVTGSSLSVIGRNTSFFALGLDSINCISLSRKLFESGCGHVDVSMILRHASVAKLSKALIATPDKNTLHRDSNSRLQHIFDERWHESMRLKYAQKGFQVQKILPCTPLQQAMLSHTEGGSDGAYQNKLSFRIRGDLHRLKDAWSTCIAAHEILRTGFVLTHSSQSPFAQVVLGEFECSWDSENHSARTQIDWEQIMMPPYSFMVSRQSEILPPKLILNIHHALYDAQAISMLLHDVERVYCGGPAQAVSSLEPYLEYMVGLNEGHADKFWQAHLKDYRPKFLSPPRQGRQPGSGAQDLVSHFSLQTSLQRLLESSKQNSVTPLSLLQLTWARLLVYHSDDPDVCFGNVYSGRNLPIRDVERIIGPCFNTLPIRTTLGKRDTNQQIVKRLQDHSLAALCFQPSSMRSIQGSQRMNRLFDTLLLLQAEPAELDPSVWTLEEELGDMKFPLILEIIPRSNSNRLDLFLHVERGVLPRGGAETILADFEIILKHTIRYPDAIATDCSMLGLDKPFLSTLTADIGAMAHLPKPNFEKDWSPLESYICDVLRKLSDRDVCHLTRYTTIFHLGFDSLSAIQIAAELRKEGYRLSSGDVLGAATVPGIASLCKQHVPNVLDYGGSFDFDDFNKRHFAEVCQQYSIDEQAVEEIRPCTPFQVGILADFVRSHGHHYLNSVHYELGANLDTRLLKKAWQAVSSRHDILNTGFVEIDNVQCPFAMILYFPGKCTLPWLEDDETPAQDPSDYAQSLLDSLHEPPWRVFIRNRGFRKTMHLSMLHALFDARMLELLLEDVAAAYRGESLPEVVPVKPFVSRILHKSSSQPADNKSDSSDLNLMPSAKFPDLHLHNLENAGFHTVEYDCSHSLSQLYKSCRKAGVTLQVAGQCAWARVLSAYTGETFPTFGVVLSGRSGENGEESILFPCINTVPVSLKVGGITNRTLLAAATERNATLVKNPFAVSKGSSISQGKVLDSLFVFQNRGPTGPSSLWELIAEDARADYTVSIELLTNRLEKLHFRLTFRNQNVPVEQGRLLAKQIDAVLLDTLDRLDGEASDFIHVANELISIAPAKDPLIETEVQYLHQLVEIGARKYPKRTSFEFAVNIVDEEVAKASWTYSQLDEEGNKIAQILQQNGAMPGNLIGICFEKCPEASFTILGILKAGCAYVALDPSAPEARKRVILEDSGCRILCTTQDRAGFLALVDNLQVLSVDELLKEADLPCHAVVLSRELVAEDVCYCLYTSGTTGTPKGCLITHGNAVQFVLAFQRLFAGHWDADSRFLQFASFHFDVSVMEQYWSWSIGICVTSAPRDLLFEDLPAAIRALQITHIDLTPSLARLLTPNECPSLCRGAFITGGEQLRQEIIDAWGDEGVIYNGYGPSEVTIGCTMYARVPKSAKPSNIGHAYDNVGAYVLEANTKHPVLRGAIGELCVSGPLVGKGYFNREELTAEKFEFLDHLQVQVYHTGDIVRLLHDGSFCFIGRADDQVKLRGQRLEIGEINHVICQSSERVQEAATMVLRHDENSKEQLVTFIASAERRAPADQIVMDFNSDLLSLMHRIRRFCNDSLPAYMVPTYIIPVTTMPLSANNKIDTKPLKELFEATSTIHLQELYPDEARQRHIDPEAMKKVVEVISRVIGLPEDAVLPSSRLFELGLDSISAISLSRLLKRARFDAANPSMVMRNSVVADLVTALTESAPILDDNGTASQVAKQEIAAFEGNHRPAIEKALGVSGHDIDKIAPCTPLQEGMIARILNSNHTVYFSSFTFALNACVDISRLLAAWMHVERENEILRTKFVLTDEGYAQVVCKDSAGPSTRFQQLTIQHEGGYENALKRDFVNWTEHVRSLENELWALDIYHMPQQNLMNLKIFHGLYDGISLALILEEIACIYFGRPSPNAGPTYHDVLPLGPLLSPAGTKDFWTKNVRTFHLLDLQFKHDLNEPIILSSDIAFSNDVKQLRLQLDVTEAAIFQACWLMTVEQKLGILPTVGIVVSGRAFEVDGIENVVGPLFNTIPCQIDVDALSTWADLVRACHSFNVEAMPYQHTPLSKISKWLGLKSTEPLFDSLFVFQKESGKAIESPKLWTQIDSRSHPDYPLALEVKQGIDDSLTCTILAQGRYMCREEIQGLLDVLKNIIMDLSKDPYQPLVFANGRRFRPLHARNIEGRSAGVTESKQMENGTIDSRNSFSWNATSILMRREIAKISASNIRDVTPYTSIFELGLDSIDAIKLSARLKAAKICISVSSILQAGCITGMVKRAAAAELSASSLLHVSPDRANEDLQRSLKAQGVPVDHYEKVLPVTPLQESMLANYQQYYSQDILRLSSDVDVEKLKSAWRVAVSSHDVLRTTFVEVDDPRSAYIYAQLVSRDFKFECFSTTLDSEADLQVILSNQQSEAGRGGINQAGLSLTFVGIGSATFLIVGLPHAVYDGWSINLLHQDVAKCYNGLQCVRPSYEPILQHILGAVSDNSCLFWSHQLRDLHPKSFYFPQAEQPAYSATNRHEASSEVPVTQATAFCRAAGVTFQSLALTCWALVLAHYLKCRDVCFGVVLAGRDIENADQMMFPTMNTVPFRVLLQGNKFEMVKETHKSILAVSEHQHFPLRKARSLVKDSAGQLFDTLFLYQKKPSQTERLKTLYTSVGGLSNPEYPVNVEIELFHDGIVWRTACASHVLDMEGTQALLRNVDCVLRSLVTETSKPALMSSSDGISICGLAAFDNWAAVSDLEDARASLSNGIDMDQPGLVPNEEIIREVLSNISNVGIEEITRDTNLFHLGLDSISAIKVASALKKRSISIPVSEMLKALTVQKMAEAAKPFAASGDKRLVLQGDENNTRLLGQGWIRHSLEQAGIQEDRVEDILPCTSGQEYFLGMWQASGGRLFYPDFYYQIRDPSISRQAIDTAWQRLVQAAPVLRTTFLCSSVPHISRLQVILKEASTTVVWTGDKVQNTEDTHSTSSYRAQSPAVLFATETPTAMFLRLRIHHALYDGVSLPKMTDLFKSFCCSSSSPVDVETDFHGYVNYLQDHVANERQKNFWTSYLNGSATFEPRHTASFETERVQVFRPSFIDNLNLIDKKLKQSAISFQALFFAAYALAHCRLMSRSARTSEDMAELAVGVYLANRSHDHEGLSRLLAPMVNVVPLKIPIRHSSSLFESARAVQVDLGKIGSIEHCSVSLSEIHKWTGVKIDCFVNFLKLPDMESGSSPIDHSVRMGEVDCEDEFQNDMAEQKPPSPFAGAVPTHDEGIYLPSIDVEAAIRNGVLDVGVFAPTGLLDRQGAEKLLDELQALLRSCDH